jgi:heme O synthase-like polyprenyltransferase
MATEPILATLDVSAVQGRRVASSYALFDYWELTKPEINFLIAITTAAGFWIGSPAAPANFSVDAIPSCALGYSLSR